MTEKDVRVLEKTWQHHGINCVVVAHPMGHRCGYVMLSKCHKWRGRTFDSLPDAGVHGGITFSRIDSFGGIAGWWIGFDCAHTWDLKDTSIMSEEYKRIFDKLTPLETTKYRTTLWTLAMVVEETEKLADQIIGMGS